MIPSKAIKNEKIMQTLMVQADSGMYRVQDHYFEACRQGLQKQDSKLSGSSDWADSLDATLLRKKRLRNHVLNLTFSSIYHFLNFM